jgi:3-oxoadipate enol-lactonase/4-carboxymuconolactone decarboxylase
VSPPRIRAVHLAGSAQLPALLVGPSLGTSVSALWRAAAQRMSATHHVIGWDLPGHGESPAPTESFSLTDLARSVLNLIDNETLSAPITYAGVSVAGAVGLQLLLDYPERLTSAALICTGVKIGDPDDWNDRAQRVCSEGTPVMIAGAMQRWFAPGFLDRDPDTANALLDSLRHTDKSGYAQTCRALALPMCATDCLKSAHRSWPSRGPTTQPPHRTYCATSPPTSQMGDSSNCRTPRTWRPPSNPAEPPN